MPVFPETASLEQAGGARPTGKRWNILFSSTRQWNCGDEFILFGARRLLAALGIDYNALLYNRHPSINPQRYIRPHRWSRSVPAPNLDNSFFLDDPSLVDYVVFAGSPEWFDGPRIRPLLRFIVDNGKRCCFLGVGVYKVREINSLLQQVLTEHCDLITARDPLCYEMVKHLPHAYYEVCPALFAAPASRPRRRLERLAYVIQAGATRGHDVAAPVREQCMQQLAALQRRFEVTCIAHYMDDLRMARQMNAEVLYSAYSEDYLELYDRFDAVISTRIHGCGLASSLGIPNALVPHDGRSQTASLFGSHLLSPGADWEAWLRTLDVAEASAALQARRAERWERYLELLGRHLSLVQQGSLPQLAGSGRGDAVGGRS